MKTMSVEEFQNILIAQGVPSHEHFAFKCPMCETVQSAADLIAAGAGANFDAVEKYVAYSCVGRWTGQRFTRESKGAGKGCDWTLGGLFRTHVLEVIFEGKLHPRFEPATPEEAKAHFALRSAE